MCGSRKYPYPPHGREWKFQGGGGVKGKAQENPEGGGVLYQFILFSPDRFPYSYMLKFLFAFCLQIRGHKH